MIIGVTAPEYERLLGVSAPRNDAVVSEWRLKWKPVVIHNEVYNFPALTPTRHHDLRTWSGSRQTDSANEVAKIEIAKTIR
jgi:hypothetical protein